jgi:hypothetical protein
MDQVVTTLPPSPALNPIQKPTIFNKLIADVEAGATHISAEFTALWKSLTPSQQSAIAAAVPIFEQVLQQYLTKFLAAYIAAPLGSVPIASAVATAENLLSQVATAANPTKV